MWVHRSGELHKDRPIVIYEYQKGRDHHIPLEFYKDYKGVLVTDGLSQYHLVDKKLPDLQTRIAGHMQDAIMPMQSRQLIKVIRPR